MILYVPFPPRWEHCNNHLYSRRCLWETHPSYNREVGLPLFNRIRNIVIWYADWQGRQRSREWIIVLFDVPWMAEGSLVVIASGLQQPSRARGARQVELEVYATYSSGCAPRRAQGAHQADAGSSLEAQSRAPSRARGVRHMELEVHVT
jgi:hypothetical protein